MDSEVKKEVEAMLETMRSPGWKFIAEDLDKLRRAYEDVRNCSNLDWAKGALSVLDMIHAWPDRLDEYLDRMERRGEEKWGDN